MNVAERKEKQEMLDEYDRREGRKSLYYFGKFVLGFDLEENPHKEMCDFVQHCVLIHKKGLQLVPRGTFKTTIVSQILPLWMIIRNPNIRILLDSVVLKNSERNLEVIKNLISSHDRFNSLFGNFKDKDQWRTGDIIVSKRTSLTLKEPTIGTSSVDTIEVGPHWDLIVPDDLHNEKNTKTREQIDAVYEHFKLLFSLLDPGCAIFLVGTRWTDLDTYGIIIENHPSFKIMQRRAIDEDGNLFFPSRFNEETLAGIKAEQGIFMFSAQYLNDPMPQGEHASFIKENFIYARSRSDLPLYMLIDPALSEAKRSDNSAIVLAGPETDKSSEFLNDIFVEKCIYGQWKPDKLIDKICINIVAYKHRLKAVVIETNFFQKILKYALMTEMKKRNIHNVKIIELHHNVKKADRIMGLQPLYECGSVHHHPGLRDGQLESELLKHPRSRRDDLADALASLLFIIHPKKKPKIPKKHMSLFDPTMTTQKIIEAVAHSKRKPRFVHPVLGSNF